MENNSLRKLVLKASYKAKACHIGSALSCVDIIEAIYERKREEDRFIFAKASGAAAFYVVLANKGFFPKNKIAYYLEHYPLASNEVPGVIHSVGSLGHGLPVATGLALANRQRMVYCLVGEGDVQCGTFYESILFARHHGLTNLEIIVDKNGLQALGATKDILGIDEALNALQKLFPIKVIKTVKGQGVDFMEGDYRWHYLNLTKSLFEQAIKGLK